MSNKNSGMAAYTDSICLTSKEDGMLKIRLQGTTQDIKWLIYLYYSFAESKEFKTWYELGDVSDEYSIESLASILGVCNATIENDLHYLRLNVIENINSDPGNAQEG